MKTLKSFSIILALTILLFCSVQAADYPTKPIMLTVGLRAGGGTDMMNRVMAKRMGELLGKNVVVNNKAGAGGAITATSIKASKPDGYTLGFAPASALAFTPERGKVAYDTDDFTYIASYNRYYFGYFAKNGGKWNDWAGMIDFGKKNKFLNYASSDPIERLVTQLIFKKEGIPLNIIPVKGGSGARQALLGGHVDFAFSGSGTLADVKSGSLLVLAMLPNYRHHDFPEIPTLMDLGYNVSYANFGVIFGPKGIPDEIVTKLANTIKTIVEEPEFTKLVTEKLRMEMKFSGPNELNAAIQEEVDKSRKLIKDNEN